VGEDNLFRNRPKVATRAKAERQGGKKMSKGRMPPGFFCLGATVKTVTLRLVTFVLPG